jgi:UPF0288 family protein (methanogenesis marker protein 3)
MTKVKVLTETEIKDIKAVREDFQILVSNVGDIEIAIMNLNKRKKEKEIELLEIQKREEEIALNLEKKYGKGNISLETGEFTPIE